MSNNRGVTSSSLAVCCSASSPCSSCRCWCSVQPSCCRAIRPRRSSAATPVATSVAARDQARPRSHRGLPVHRMAEGIVAAIPVTRSTPAIRSSTTSAIASSTHCSSCSCASAISIPLSLWLGGYCARKRDTTFDNVVSNVMLALASLPEFVIGTCWCCCSRVNVWHVFPAVSVIGDRKAVVRPDGDGPADHRARPRCVFPYIVAGRADVDDRGARERLRRDGSPEGMRPEWRAVASCAAERARPHVPGHGAEPRLPRRRRHHRGRSSTIPASVGAARRDRVPNIPVIQFIVMLIATVYVVVNMARRCRHDPRHPPPANEDAMSLSICPSTLLPPIVEAARAKPPGVAPRRAANVAHADRPADRPRARAHRPARSAVRAVRRDRGVGLPFNPRVRPRQRVRHRQPRSRRVVAVPLRRQVDPDHRDRGDGAWSRSSVSPSGSSLRTTAVGSTMC